MRTEALQRASPLYTVLPEESLSVIVLPEDMLTELPALPGNPPYGFPPVKPPLVSLVSPEKPPLGGVGINI